MLFSGSPEGRYTLVPSFMEGTEIAFIWIWLPFWWGEGRDETWQWYGEKGSGQGDVQYLSSLEEGEV